MPHAYDTTCRRQKGIQPLPNTAIALPNPWYTCTDGTLEMRPNYWVQFTSHGIVRRENRLLHHRHVCAMCRVAWRRACRSR